MRARTCANGRRRESSDRARPAGQARVSRLGIALVWLRLVAGWLGLSLRANLLGLVPSWLGRAIPLLLGRHILDGPAEDLGLLARQAEFEILGLGCNCGRLVALCIVHRFRLDLHPAVRKLADAGQSQPDAILGLRSEVPRIGRCRPAAAADIAKIEGVDEGGEL